MFCVLKRNLFRQSCFHKNIRNLYWQSNDVRLAFYEFFKERQHQYAPPSSIIPLADSSLNFTNAGMNQFKPIFLGMQEPIYKRAYNSQKCIRVGGKHNDLSAVGNDSFHHTFFEMLGSWSFGDYFKKESCTMTWQLLTDVYKIPPENLFVTYFGGDDTLKLLPDLETKEIWLQIGVPDSRILPFGCKENFWEMGPTGPCGPCTEVHYSHDPDKFNSEYVNKGLENLVELWNIVFIQHERLHDGSIKPLNSYYVDTGMGLERITAVLNGKMSNYDTDLFAPLFETIHQLSRKPRYSGKFGDGSNMDKAYRILADHSRMIAVSLCDKLLPNDSVPLKDILRKCVNIGRVQFGFTETDDWLYQLCECNAQILGDAHPVLKKNITGAKEIITHHEQIVWNAVKIFTSYWKELTKSYPKLTEVTNVDYELVNSIKSIVSKFKAEGNDSRTLPISEGVKIIRHCDISKEDFRLIIDAIGVSCDVEECFEILNKVDFKRNPKTISESILLKSENRHLITMTHLVIAALNAVSGKVYLREVEHTTENLTILSFHDITSDQFVKAEEIIRHWIKTGAKVSRKFLPLSEAVANENCELDYRKTYPLDVWVVNIESAPNPTDYEVSSMRICDRTHLENTSDLNEFTFSQISCRNFGIIMVSGIYGNKAKELLSKVAEIKQSVGEWKVIVNDALDRDLRLRPKLAKWLKWKFQMMQKDMPAAFRLQISSEIDQLMRKVDVIVSPPSNIEEVLKEGRNIIKQHNGDGIYQHICIDYRGNLPNLLSLVNGDEKFPVIFICKGWGKMGVIAYIPQDCHNISLQTLFEEIQVFYRVGNITFRKKKNIACLGYHGFKFKDLDKLPEILNICKSYIEKKS